MMKKPSVLIFLFLLAISSFFIFWKLGTPELADWDEGIYAVVATEIAETGNWHELRLRGEAWYEKEPLLFWLMAGSVQLFGITEFAIRFPAAMITIFYAPLLFVAARFWMKNIAALITSLFLFVSPILFAPHMLRTGDFDMVAATLFLGALAAYLWWRDKKLWWVAPAVLALAIMTRGSLAIIHASFIFLIECIRPFFGKKRWGIKHLLAFIGISLSPWLAWHVLQFMQGGDLYVRVYWIEQFFSRVSAPLHNHSGTVTYYADVIRHYLTSPVLYVSIVAALFACYEAIKKRTWTSTVLVLWIIASFGPQHILSTKLAWYIAPALAPLAIAIALPFVAVGKKLQNRFISGAFACVMLFLASTLGFVQLQKINALDEGPKKRFVNEIESIIPADSTIMVYNTEAWNIGGVLPAMHWYLSMQQDWNTITLDANNFEQYAQDAANYPWWIVHKKDYETTASSEAFSTLSHVQTNEQEYALFTFPEENS